MKARLLILFTILLTTTFSCMVEEDEDLDTISIEGFIRDEVSNKPLPGIYLIIDAIDSGNGGFFSGKRVTVGSGRTDANGYYKIKMKVFKEAERLEFDINPGNEKQEHVYAKKLVEMSSITRGGSNYKDFTLSPVTLLKVRFKNTSPFSDADLFFFEVSGNGWPSNIRKEENCGTILMSQARTWRGKDVCGITTLTTIPDQQVPIFWWVEKNGIKQEYTGKVLTERGKTSEFIIEY